MDVFMVTTACGHPDQNSCTHNAVLQLVTATVHTLLNATNTHVHYCEIHNIMYFALLSKKYMA